MNPHAVQHHLDQRIHPCKYTIMHTNWADSDLVLANVGALQICEIFVSKAWIRAGLLRTCRSVHDYWIRRSPVVPAVTRSRRNPRSRCAWLTGPEPRWGYARTSFGVDAAAEVTISKCNLWKSWTLELTSEFSHAHLTIFSTVWDAGWFYQDHASRVNAKSQKIYQYFVG